jgi:hypothetical protein
MSSSSESLTLQHELSQEQDDNVYPAHAVGTRQSGFSPEHAHEMETSQHDEYGHQQMPPVNMKADQAPRELLEKMARHFKANSMDGSSTHSDK